MITFLLIFVIIMLAIGAPIFAVMLAATLLGAMTLPRDLMTEFSGPVSEVFRLGQGEHASILATIPLFIFAGYLMAESKTADRLVRAANVIVGWLPGGIALVTVGACAIFTVFSGASGVTIVAMGGLVMPSLIKQGYPQRFSLGLVAGTGSVGLLFPPALPLFIYGTVYGVAAQVSSDTGQGDMQLIEFSTDRFLLAGIVPGLVLCGLIVLYCIAIAILRGVPREPMHAKNVVYFVCPPLAIAVGAFLTLKALLTGRLREMLDDPPEEWHLLRALPELVIPVLVVAVLVLGWSTIPEAAALTVVYVFAIEAFLYRDLRASGLWRIIRESMALVGAIFIIILCASALTNYFVTAGVPNMLVDWITERIDDKWMFLLALNVMLLFVGMLMDIFSAIVVVVPLITPVAMRYGIDPYHLGVVFLLNLELGYITPPVGLNLFITSFKFNQPILSVMRATLPFLLIMIVALGLVTYVPALTVVPEPERRGRVATLAKLVADEREQMGMVQSVAAPDGTKITLEGCEDIDDPLLKASCQGMFKTYSECADDACRERVVQEYLDEKEAAEGGGWDDEEDWGDDEDWE